MSVHRSSKTFTTRSVLGSAGHASSGGQVMNGLGSSGVSLSFGAQNYGSAGGYGARLSRSLSTSSLTTAVNEVNLYPSEKQTMQNLNDRLASYLERVHSLEQANKKLELQIKEFYDNKSPVECKNLSAYLTAISELSIQIQSRFVENAKLRLKLDNTKFATEDFHLKYDLHLLRERQSGSVNVEMDCAAHSDLDKELQEMRAQYEMLIEKNRREAERWFQSKVSQTVISTSESSMTQTSMTKTMTETETVTKTMEIMEEEEEEYNPHVQRRVKVIVEEIVDGKVVSSSVEEKVHEIS
ncbi:unnamed protein product [Leuciscus chuanchicus]